MTFFALGLFAQNPTGVTYEKILNAPVMKWECRLEEKYQRLLSSLQDEDPKNDANRLKKEIALYSDSLSPSIKYLMTGTLIEVSNPLFNKENLLNHIASWIKGHKTYKEFSKNLKTDKEKSIITSSASFLVASATSAFTYDAGIPLSLVIHLVGEDSLVVSLWTDRYNIGKLTGEQKSRYSHSHRISEMFPFDSNSKYKNTCALAYIRSYQFNWNFISNLIKELNTNFTRDNTMLNRLKIQKDIKAVQLC